MLACAVNAYKEATYFQHRRQQGYGGYSDQIVCLHTTHINNGLGTNSFIKGADQDNGDMAFQMNPFN